MLFENTLSFTVTTRRRLYKKVLFKSNSSHADFYVNLPSKVYTHNDKNKVVYFILYVIWIQKNIIYIHRYNFHHTRAYIYTSVK